MIDVASRLQALGRVRAALPGLQWVDDAAQVARLSQDFYWYSPVLKQQLAGRVADAVVRPRDVEELRALVGACAREGVSITPRGAGTGNYGQAVPLHGGVVIDFGGLNRATWIRRGAGRAQAGMRLADFDRAAREHGQELRLLPSTYRIASVGGLFAGGFGGIGSINFGPGQPAGCARDERRARASGGRVAWGRGPATASHVGHQRPGRRGRARARAGAGLGRAHRHLCRS
jgi:hypothetical protein